jgi:hypothetical protein
MVGSKIGKINSLKPITLNAECVLEAGGAEPGAESSLADSSVVPSWPWGLFPSSLVEMGAVIALLTVCEHGPMPSKFNLHAGGLLSSSKKIKCLCNSPSAFLPGSRDAIPGKATSCD